MKRYGWFIIGIVLTALLTACAVSPRGGDGTAFTYGEFTFTPSAQFTYTAMPGIAPTTFTAGDGASFEFMDCPAPNATCPAPPYVAWIIAQIAKQQPTNGAVAARVTGVTADLPLTSLAPGASFISGYQYDYTEVKDPKTVISHAAYKVILNLSSGETLLIQADIAAPSEASLPGYTASLADDLINALRSLKT